MSRVPSLSYCLERERAAYPLSLWKLEQRDPHMVSTSCGSLGQCGEKVVFVHIREQFSAEVWVQQRLAWR